MTTFDVLKHAHKNKYALGAFNVANIETLKAIMQAVTKYDVPVIIEASDGEINFFGMEELVAVVSACKRKHTKPVVLNLDHGKDFDTCIKALNAGFDYIHFDGSKLPFDQNVTITQEIVKIAHARGVPVEGEFNHIEGSSADHTQENAADYANDSMFTDPDQAHEFVSKTGVDVFAVFIGNLHGVYANELRLDLPRLQAIKAKLPDTYFSLHGGSGVNADDVTAAIQLGVVKVNVNSEMRIAFRISLESVLAKSKEIAIYKIMSDPILAVQSVVESKLKIFASQKI